MLVYCEIMKRFLHKTSEKFFGDSLDFRAQIFNALGFLGIALGLGFGIFTMFVSPAISNVLANFGASVIAAVIIWRANSTGHFKWYFLVTVIVVFLIIFPLLFFVGGGYTSGMPSFFVFAVVFTVIMLEGKRRTFFTVFEILLYAVCFLTAYLRPETVVPFPAEANMIKDIIVGCLGSAVVLAIAIYQHIVVYDRKQKEIENANDALTGLDRLKTELFQNMNHDMKTPLTVIETYINNADDMLEHGVDIAEVRECLTHAQKQIEDLARLMEYSISLAAAQEAGRRMEQLDLSSLLRDVAEIFNSTLKKDGNTLSIQITDGLPKITGSANMLKQAVGNLLFNSAKYTRNGVITVSLTQNGDKLTTTITDTGEGIAPELLPRVFERGVSGDGTTGYGLSICKVIIEMHGGKISIESEPGKGTEVFFTLPL